MDASAHPSLLFSLGSGFLTALTPCVYPMIPITLAIFGVKAGMPRWRAIALAVLRRRHRRDVRRAGDAVRAAPQPFGTYLGNPWVVVSAGAVLHGDGAVDVRRLRARVPAGLQERLSRVGGNGFVGRVPDGPGGAASSPRRARGRRWPSLLAYVTTTRDAAWGFATLATYGVGVGVAVLVARRVFDVAAAAGRWMEWVKSVFGILCPAGGPVLPQERRSRARSVHLRRARCSRWRCWR